MGLSLLDCRVGTIVDHRYECSEDGRQTLRPRVRRGIIVRVDGEANSAGGVSALWVKFGKDTDPEEVQARELARYLPATNKHAREAYRRIMGVPKMVGRVEEQKVVVRPQTVDELALTPTKNAGPVSQEDEDTYVAGVDVGEDEG